MDEFEQKKDPQNLSWWIASLALSVVLCAMFAGYVFDIKEDLHNAKIHSEIMEQRLDMMNSQLDNMRHRLMVQQAQIISPDKSMQLPSIAPAPEGQNVTVPAAPNMVPVPPPAHDMPSKH